MTDQEAVSRAKRIIGESPFSALATLDQNGWPQSRAMMPAGLDDDLTVYYVTSRQSAKCGQIAANPKASSLWTKVVEPMSNWRTVLVKGNARVSDEKALRERFWMDEVGKFFPGGVDDPNYVIVVIKPTELILADTESMPPVVVKL